MEEILVNLCIEECESLEKGNTIDLVEVGDKIVRLKFDKNLDPNGE